MKTSTLISIVFGLAVSSLAFAQNKLQSGVQFYVTWETIEYLQLPSQDIRMGIDICSRDEALPEGSKKIVCTRLQKDFKRFTPQKNGKNTKNFIVNGKSDMFTSDAVNVAVAKSIKGMKQPKANFRASFYKVGDNKNPIASVYRAIPDEKIQQEQLQKPEFGMEKATKNNDVSVRVTFKLKRAKKIGVGR